MREVKRAPVNYRYDGLNWDFIKLMAEIAHLGATKYGSVEQYADARLTEGKSPLNHVIEHYRQYMAGEKHDHFGTLAHHLAAIAYNAMMEFFYHENYGYQGTKLVKPAEEPETLESRTEPEPEPPLRVQLDNRQDFCLVDLTDSGDDKWEVEVVYNSIDGCKTLELHIPTGYKFPGRNAAMCVGLGEAKRYLAVVAGRCLTQPDTSYIALPGVVGRCYCYSRIESNKFAYVDVIFLSPNGSRVVLRNHGPHASLNGAEETGRAAALNFLRREKARLGSAYRKPQPSMSDQTGHQETHVGPI